ncbi:hypothetical protein SLEP1_g1842 [Rubroshorea leprosula]|uniref:Glutamate receptor n=1 Tax=Rubroshorea leprosula TaxID=152421 RepID=A0AAV5HLR9_9ROSI|nr:hypothetical protein SLEP1_g1842 [Rubroshorea leprosula]
MKIIPTKHLFHLSCLLVFCRLLLAQVALAQNTTAAATIPVNVGVVLDMGTWVGKLGLSCINMALQDFYSYHSNHITRLVLNVRDSKGDVVGAAAAGLDLIKNVQVQAIIGTENSMQANFVIDLGNKAQVPIISFSATSPSLSSIRSPYFLRATQNDSSQVKVISAIVEAFGWKEAVPIYVDNEFGEEVIPYLTDALEEVNVRIPNRSIISQKATDEEIEGELYKLKKMKTRVFIVHMTPELGSRVFDKAKEIGMMDEGYVWIITDGMTNVWSLVNPLDMDSMQGVLGVRTYIPKSKELDCFKVRWKRKFLQDNPSYVNADLDIFGLWAYDATFALAMPVEKLGTTNFNFDVSNVSTNARTDLESFGVSQNGPKLMQLLSNTRFRGLIGEFGFINGQLDSSVFQIINVNGNGERGVGFWTPKYGVVKKLDFRNVTEYSTSKSNLGTIIWPGDSQVVPKGEAIRLKIGVPIKNGFSEFVSVPHGTIPNSIVHPSGYCIDVFKAVMEEIPYTVSYDFYAFEKLDGKMAGDYNDLIDQVFYGNYDAVVGDVSIVANRSSYVDFTLPFTDSGVVMVVPIRKDLKQNAWVFLKPLTWELWVTSGCFFIFIGFVIWVLEHRVNEDFRGPPLYHIGTSYWFSFSTMTFSQRERVMSNLARFVVVIWCFVVLILTQTYTANLASLLTVQQLQPTVNNVNELLRKKENVGYQDGSFVREIIQKVGFDPSTIKNFNSTDDLNELFIKGSANGGIAAAFDEIPYMKLFLAQYCNYTFQPIFKTRGFGFVFPKGSPLVVDVSRAVLTVIEGDRLKQIEEVWFKNQTSCSDSSTSVSSSSLGLGSFWGLFLIAGVAAVLALIIFVSDFLYKHKDVLRNTEISIWDRILEMLKIFDDRDPKAHTFKQTEIREGGHNDGVRIRGAKVPVEAPAKVPAEVPVEAPV